MVVRSELFACVLLLCSLICALSMRARKVSDLIDTLVQEDSSQTGLCNAKDVQSGCGVLGGRQGTWMSAAEFAKAISAEEAGVAEFLEAVGITKDSFTCTELCEATVATAPALLDVAVPQKSKRACLNKNCTQQLETSDAVLSEVVQSHLPGSDEEVNGNQTRGVAAMAHATQEAVEAPSSIAFDNAQAMLIPYGTEELIRMVTQVFQVFLVPEEELEDASTTGGSSLAEVDHPGFGPLMLEKSQKDLDKMNHAVLEGQVWISAALRRIDDASDDLEWWFGTSDSATVERVKNMLFRGLHAVNNLYIKVGSGDACKPGTLAYTTPGNRLVVDGKHKYIVYVCPHWWTFMQDPDIFYGTMIHEGMHHFGTTDVEFTYGGGTVKAYGNRLAHALATQSSKDAFLNAENYEMFVYAAVHNNALKEAVVIDTTADKCLSAGQPFSAKQMCMRIRSLESCEYATGHKASGEFRSRYSTACFGLCERVSAHMKEQGSDDCSGIDAAFPQKRGDVEVAGASQSTMSVPAVSVHPLCEKLPKPWRDEMDCADKDCSGPVVIRNCAGTCCNSGSQSHVAVPLCAKLPTPWHDEIDCTDKGCSSPAIIRNCAGTCCR